MSDLSRIANQPVANLSTGSGGSGRSGDTQQAQRAEQSAVVEALDKPSEAEKLAKASQQLNQAQNSPLDRATEILEAVLKNVSPNTRLRIDLDQDTGRFVYRSVDRQSGEVVSQFPPEQILKFLGALREVEGLVIDQEV